MNAKKVVAGGNAAKLLELVEEALDMVALAIGLEANLASHLADAEPLR